MTCRLKAPDELFNSTVSVGDGTEYHVPPNGIIEASMEDVHDLLSLGFWPYRLIDQMADEGSLGGGAAADPGDLTVYFDNQLV